MDSDSVDLIVASPPYANALDYMRAHKFSLAWLGNPIPRLSRLRSRYIGAERQDGAGDANNLPASVMDTVHQLARVDAVKSRVLLHYFAEMAVGINEMARVLRPGAATIIVVGPSVMRGVEIPTHDCLAEIAAHRGLKVMGVAPLIIDRDRRMMPVRRGGPAQVGMGIERRMHTEYVIGAVKP